MLTGRHFAIFVLVALCCHGSAVAAVAIPSMTDSQKKEALFQDDLSVPSPGEVFAALDKVCHPNWATLVTPATAPVTMERSQLALAVGVLAANGYIAVEAQDGQQVKNVGREMMEEAKSLGVSQRLMSRGNSLMEFANNSDWDALANELEATENEVKTTMVEQKDRDLVTLTSAAAWLRGLEVASEVVLASKSLQGASLLRQPELARTLASRLEALPARMKRGFLVLGVKQTLESSASLLENSDPAQLRGNLQKVHDDSAAIVKAILSSSSVKSSSTPTQTATGGVTNSPSPGSPHSIKP